MEALSCFPFWCRKKRDAGGQRLFYVIAVTMVTVGFLVSCANANSADFSRFQGESDDWVGTCPAQFVVGTPADGMISATLTVMCDHRPAVEETMTGAFMPQSGRYHAVVTGIKTAQNFNYDQDKSFDLVLTPDGCTMSGIVSDADGSSNIRFDSTAQDCP